MNADGRQEIRRFNPSSSNPFITFVSGEKMKYSVAVMQGIYFFVAGLWPIIDMSTLLKFAGPITDLWLVKTIGIRLLSSFMSQNGSFLLFMSPLRSLSSC